MDATKRETFVAGLQNIVGSRHVLTDPTLFAEVLSYIYLPEGQDPAQVTPEQSARAMVGFTVLREWHTPPGVRPDETVDADALRNWVTEARRLLADSDGPPQGTSRSAGCWRTSHVAATGSGPPMLFEISSRNSAHWRSRRACTTARSRAGA